MRFFIVIIFVCFAMAGCSVDPKKQIVGKWGPTDKSSDLEALEFDSGGGLKVHLKGETTPIEGTYELEGGKVLKLKVRNEIMSWMKERVKRVGTNSATLPFWIMYDKPTQVSLTKSEFSVKDGEKTLTYTRGN